MPIKQQESNIQSYVKVECMFQHSNVIEPINKAQASGKKVLPRNKTWEKYNNAKK